MSIQHPPHNLTVVELPFEELRIAEELKSVNDALSEKPDCDVIVDFARVEVITSSSISNLLILQNLLAERGRRLILCNVSVITKCVFKVAGIDDVFEFMDNKLTAVAAVHTAQQPSTPGP